MKKVFFIVISFILFVLFSSAEEKTEEAKKITVDTSETLKKSDDKKDLEIDTSNTLNGDKKKSLEMDTSNTLNGNKKKSLEFDTDSTFDSSKQELPTGTSAENIKERLKKDPERGKFLLSKTNDVSVLVKEAQKINDAKTAEACSKVLNSMKLLAEYHSGKDFPSNELFQAYNDCKYMSRKISELKMRVSIAKKNSPQIRKIRKFRRLSSNYESKAKIAAMQGYKAKAEYYNTCAVIFYKAASDYSKNPEIESECNAKVKEARKKYNTDDARESASRFRRRARIARAKDDNKKAEYYEKVAILKDKLHEAYKNDDIETVKSLLKEYSSLRSKR